jgi:hypothetical protein
MTHVTVSESVVERLRRAAKKRGTSVPTLVERAIEQYLAEDVISEDQAVTTTNANWLEQIEREQVTFEAQHLRLLEMYRGETIAMRGGQVIDHDIDESALWQRVHQHYANQPILITPVNAIPRQVVTIRSPRAIEKTP